MPPKFHRYLSDVIKQHWVPGDGFNEFRLYYKNEMIRIKIDISATDAVMQHTWYMKYNREYPVASVPYPDAPGARWLLLPKFIVNLTDPFEIKWVDCSINDMRRDSIGVMWDDPTRNKCRQPRVRKKLLKNFIEKSCLR